MKLLQHFTVKDLIVITSIAALGIAVKPIINPITKIISTPLGIPGGSLTGGLYMLWLVLTIVIVDKPLTGTLYGFLQSILVLLIGMAGRMGAFSLVAYTLPGIIADLIYWLYPKKNKLLTHLLLCAFANLTGSLVSSAIFFKMPPLMIGFNTCLALASGIIGGYLGFGIYQSLKATRII
ncbi:MAG TPA: ECF transporter S component [Candidatus Cloacimonas sp.]|jgi:energy-coupling factor transport system substrate-specific component|nr:ECF transporter S component [Candidatus Cloacimonas sp.]MDD2250627.1 ECF transporter S component [Candidatus Cloacimonadota bacterium]MDD3870250.1 ECF transporter S component [Candidatus Cloacimonadota bacterium]MDD4676975.1 ECF transporter S component [Candidatus Cloacimonadota bacterium]HOG26311.1 ECF transporter S component [Candidatus Cloacimonas sp.]